MHKSRLGAVVVDCKTSDLFKDAEFWSAALGATAEEPGSQIGQKYVRLEARGDEVQLILQDVDHPSRVHIDIETDNIKAEVARLRELGASVVNTLEKWVVMEAPSGHRFCVIGPVRDGFDDNANEWE